MNPIIYVGATLGVLSLIFIIAYLCIKDKKEAFGFDRNMKDSEITKRLLMYAKPYYKNFIVVFIILLLIIGADIILPIITGSIVDVIQQEGGFRYSQILNKVILYISLLLLSLSGTYIQSMTLQKTGQRNVKLQGFHKKER